MDKVVFVLCPEERRLILKHAYPFEPFEKELRDSQGDPDLLEFELSDSYFNHLLGELARTINRSKNRKLQLRLDEIYERLKRDPMYEDRWL